ncbi:hypothetical protein COO60DRAFT_572639 [Scenedesmus sp. NREL 46B-D3]|nr:hypothetical protein COO60DRAFT_572639 [Scenedesmus sp. NREL 46B-D3]
MYSYTNQSNSVQTGACRSSTAVVTTPRITSQETKHLPSQAPTKNTQQWAVAGALAIGRHRCVHVLRLECNNQQQRTATAQCCNFHTTQLSVACKTPYQYFHPPGRLSLANDSSHPAPPSYSSGWQSHSNSCSKGWQLQLQHRQCTHSSLMLCSSSAHSSDLCCAVTWWRHVISESEPGWRCSMQPPHCGVTSPCCQRQGCMRPTLCLLSSNISLPGLISTLPAMRYTALHTHEIVHTAAAAAAAASCAEQPATQVHARGDSSATDDSMLLLLLLLLTAGQPRQSAPTC